METFGERLKRFRKEKGLTQLQISEALNIHEQTVSRWERDKSSPDMSMFAGLSKILGVSLEELWGISSESSIDPQDRKGEFSTIGLGKKICAERKKINESQNTLAAVLNVSSDTVSKWERGVICPDLTTFLFLAEHFGISPAKLYYAAANESETKEESEGSGSEGLEVVVTDSSVSENAEPKADKKRKNFIILLSAAALIVLMVGGVLLGSLNLNQGNALATCAHQYESSITPATCITQGYTTYTCSLCSESYKKDYTPMIAHTPSDWIVDEAATCLTDGSSHKECTYCHDVMETQTLNSTGHTYNEQIFPPLNGARGYTLHVCRDCGDSYKDTYVIGGSQGLTYEFNNDTKTFTVTGIGTCTDTEISIPSTVNDYPVTAIGENAFNKSTATAFWIPESVTQIGDYAFSDCDNLLSMTIPTSVTAIGGSIFEDCNNLAEVIYNSDSEPLNGISFLKLPTLKKIIFGGTCVPNHICKGATNVEEVVIPYGIMKIEDEAFKDCVNLKVIDLPDSVNIIGSNPFSNCGVTELVLPLGMTTTSRDMCCDAYYLKKVTLPSTLETLAYATFYRCNSLESINLENVKIIENEVFCGCNSLTEVTLSEGLTRIGYSVFSGCENLKKINIPDSVTLIDGLAFNTCKSLANVVLPSNLTYIGGYAFSNCDNLTEILIPASVNSIMDNAFVGSWNLSKVIFECTDGWYAGNEKLDSLQLKDHAMAATYLKDTFSYVSWKRSKESV